MFNQVQQQKENFYAPVVGGSLVDPNIVFQDVIANDFPSYLVWPGGYVLPIPISSTRLLVLTRASTQFWGAHLLALNADGSVTQLDYRRYAFPNTPPSSFAPTPVGYTKFSATSIYVAYFVLCPSNTLSNYSAGQTFDVSTDKIVVSSGEQTLLAAFSAAGSLVPVSSTFAALFAVNGANNLTATYLTLTASTVTVTATTTFSPTIGLNGGASAPIIAAAVSATQFVGLYSVTGNANQSLVSITVSGTAFTAGTPTALTAATYGTCVNLIITSATSGFVTYFSSSRLVVGVVPWTLAAGVFTLGTKIEWTANVASASGMSAALVSSTNLMVFYTDASGQWARIVSGNGTVLNTPRKLFNASGYAYALDSSRVLLLSSLSGPRFGATMCSTYGPVVA